MARRIRIYLIGVFLGCLVVYATLLDGGDKKRMKSVTAWFPSERILYDIEHNPKLSFTSKLNCQVEKCSSLDSVTLIEQVLDGDVLFSHDQTNPHVSPSIYIVDLQNDENLLLKVQLDSTFCVFETIIKEEGELACDCR